MDNFQVGFRQTLSELIERLKHLEPAKDQHSAHKQIAETLNEIEDIRRGTTYKEDFQVIGTERMVLWPLEKIYWELATDPAHIELEKGYQVDLYLDGSMRIARFRNGNLEVLLFKHGA